MSYTIYVHIAPNNKKYFGITCKSVEHRWGRNGCGYKNNKHFYRAIQKYGWNNIEHIVLLENLSRSWALQLECDLIYKHKTYLDEYGYNHSIGGDYGGCGYTFRHSMQTRQYLKNLKSGVPLSDEHKLNLKTAWVHRKESGKGVPWNKGLHLKESGCLDNFINAGRENAKRLQRVVQQIDLYSGSIIAEYESVSMAARSLGKTYTSSIIDTALGKRKSAFGYGWKYINS